MWALTRRTNKVSDEYHYNSLKVIQNRPGHNHTYKADRGTVPLRETYR